MGDVQHDECVMAYNPYSAYSRRGDDGDDRQALLDALDDPQPQPPPPPMQARPRTPPPPQPTRDRLSGPGGRTQVLDRTRDTEDGRDLTNAFSGDVARPLDAGGDRFADERPEPSVYQPPSTTTPTPTGTQAQPPTHRYNPQTGFDLMDAYDDPYRRRMEGSPGYGSSAAQGAGIGGSIVPGAGHVVGALAGVIGAAFAKNAETAMTDFAIDDARQIISQAHKDAFGSDITPEYLDQIVRGQGWQDGDRWMGQDSLAYVLDAFAQQAPGERARLAAENAAAATPATDPAAPPAGATAAGTGGGLPFAGFDFNRAQDPTTSAKDAFAAAAQQAPPMTDTSKAGAEAWFREHIAPRMEAAGFRIYDMQGDKAWVGSREDPEGKIPVDWLINAGGSNPQIGWQPDSGGGGVAGGAENAQAAYDQLSGSISPNASKEEMESAIAAAFGHLPGYGGAYKESVMLNGQWYDLVRGYGGADAAFQGLVPKEDGGGATTSTGGGAGLIGGSGLNLAPNAQLAAPLGRSDVNAQIMAELQRLLSGQPPRDELLEALG
jgi:hypothetical protein